MSLPLILVLVMVVMFAGGFYLLLDRTLTRILIGFLLVGNATNLMIFLTTGQFGSAPIVGEGADADGMSDPLPQAFILTSIVITFGISAFMLALMYRSWDLARHEEDAVQDDLEDRPAGQPEALSSGEVTDEDLEETPEFSDGPDDDGDAVARGGATSPREELT